MTDTGGVRQQEGLNGSGIRNGSPNAVTTPQTHLVWLFALFSARLNHRPGERCFLLMDRIIGLAIINVNSFDYKIKDKAINLMIVKDIYFCKCHIAGYVIVLCERNLSEGMSWILMKNA